MIVFRLSKAHYSKSLSGEGARKYGGRWNSKGILVIYTCESRALCVTEIAVHTPLGNIPLGYELISIEIPDDIQIKELNSKTLPADWRSFPHPHSTQEIGDQFCNDAKYLVLKVPSVIVQGEFNYLINPDCKDFEKIKIKSIEAFNFDERLFKTV